MTRTRMRTVAERTLHNGVGFRHFSVCWRRTTVEPETRPEHNVMFAIHCAKNNIIIDGRRWPGNGLSGVIVINIFFFCLLVFFDFQTCFAQKT